jgi:hypothetical protein
MKTPLDSRVDHFKLWKVDEVGFQMPVTLKGQFDRRKWAAQIESVQYIGNPVRKNNEPIRNPNTHLVAYFLKQADKPGPRRWVTLANQFGDARWRLSDPVFLLVPAGKAFPPRVPAKPAAGLLDHFLCYLVHKPTAFQKNLTLVDQFDLKRETVERITELEPAFFAVPVEKNGEKIVNAKTHLAIYDITPHETAQPPFTVATQDQLRGGTLKATESMLLAVPSEKKEWGPDSQKNDDL